MKKGWKQELIARSRQPALWGELLVILAFVSLTFFTPLGEARVAVHTSFDGTTAFFAPLFVAGFLLLLREMKFTTPPLLILPLARLSLFFFTGLILAVGAAILLEQLSMTLLSMTVFLLFFNYPGAKKLFRRVLVAFSFVVSVQIIVCVIGLGSEYDKHGVLAGIGRSNYAATFLLIAITFLLFYSANRIEIGVLILSVIALVLTMSSGAFLALFVIGCIWYGGKLARKPKLYLLILAGIVILIVLIAVLSTQVNVFYRLTRPISSKLKSFFSGNYDGATSSRLSLYRYSLSSIGRHPVFGSIVNVNDVDANTRFEGGRTHNLILESLLLYGIVGTLINALIVFEIVRRARKLVPTRPGRRTLIFVCLAMVLHGFVEPNFFTVPFEIFVWSTLALLVSPHPAEDDPIWNGKRLNAEPAVTEVSVEETSDAPVAEKTDA